MSRKILLAEDDPLINRTLKTYLEKSNYEVFSAFNGEDAYTIFRQVKIDLVVSDIMMPKLNGYELLQLIRSVSNVPFIVISALGSEENIQRGHSLRADDYFVKPFSPKLLISRIDSFLNR